MFEKIFPLDVGHSFMVILGPLLGFLYIQLFYSPFVDIFKVYLQILREAI